jgi:integrase
LSEHGLQWIWLLVEALVLQKLQRHGGIRFRITGDLHFTDDDPVQNQFMHPRVLTAHVQLLSRRRRERKLPLILSREEVKALLEAPPNEEYRVRSKRRDGDPRRQRALGLEILRHHIRVIVVAAVSGGGEEQDFSARQKEWPPVSDLRA